MARPPARLKWIGTLFQIAGVFALSARLAPPHIAFAIMLAGSLLWFAAAVRGRDAPAAALNLAFSVSSLVGIVRWWVVG